MGYHSSNKDRAHFTNDLLYSILTACDERLTTEISNLIDNNEILYRTNLIKILARNESLQKFSLFYKLVLHAFPGTYNLNSDYNYNKLCIIGKQWHMLKQHSIKLSSYQIQFKLEYTCIKYLNVNKLVTIIECT